MNRSIVFLLPVAILVVIAALSIFTVKETEKAIKLRLGEIERADYEPGAHLKIPFINTVHKFDSRVLTLDAEPERVLTSEKKALLVDSFVKWRIADVENFFRSTGGDERRARALLSQFIQKGMRDEFGKRTVQDVIAGERVQLMQAVLNSANERSSQLGIEMVDVRVKKIELPPDVSNSVFQRMEKERETVAKSFRSRGEEQAQGIRAASERQREEILAEAYAESERIRGEGDAVAADTYAQSFGRNPEFYRFYRSLNAYKATFGNESDLLILEPDSEFFQYFKKSNQN